MTKKELWKIYSKRNPSFDSEKGNVTLSAAGLRKLFETTWDIAMYKGEEEPTYKQPPYGDIDALRQIFGMQ